MAHTCKRLSRNCLGQTHLTSKASFCLPSAVMHAVDAYSHLRLLRLQWWKLLIDSFGIFLLEAKLQAHAASHGSRCCQTVKKPEKATEHSRPHGMESQAQHPSGWLSNCLSLLPFPPACKRCTNFPLQICAGSVCSWA